MRELPRGLKAATVFALVFTVVFLIVLAWERHQAGTRFVAQGGQVQLKRARDGHYHWPGSIGGRRVDFLVDTGASSSAIPQALAEQLGLSEVGRTRSSTAAGVVVAPVVQVDLQLDGGLRSERLRVLALPGLASPLLGMDVLGRLRWQQEGGVLKIDLGGAR